ncbi:hypothetical protein V6N12_066740 [Hibiscus sabdariffa]|uniref:Uncharacterized protein n=1 Tax=Hibiscus sabdariffa TaxID=183260 RepID=A0ABR2BFK0_9ROSI
MAPPIIPTLISLSLNKPSCFQKSISSCSISVVFFSSSANQESRSPLSLPDHFIQKHNFPPEIAVKTEPSERIFIIRFSTNDVADILAVDPWILSRSVDDRIAPSILDLKSVVGSIPDVVKLLKTSAWFLKCDLQKTMMPNIEYLRSCGISSSQIVSYVFSFPRFFLHKPESIKQFIKRADDLGFDRKSNMFLAAIRMFSSMSEENWELKVKLSRKLGFSEDDILSTFWKTPQVFAVSERKIKEVTDFLLTRKDVSISFIISQPSVLVCSLEHRRKPRLLVIDTLESKNLLRRKVSLTTIYKMSEQNFREKYVHPYLKELENASMAIVGA